jgi:hypothetical protein
MKTKRAMKFPDLVLRAIMRGLDVIMKCMYREGLVQHSGDGAGGTLDSGMRNLR